MGTQKLKKVPMGTGSLKWGPMWPQCYSRQGSRIQCCMFKSHLLLEPRLAMDKGRDREHDSTQHKVAKVVVAEL